MKAQALDDHLAENPVNDEYQSLSTYFPNEEVNSFEVIPEGANAWKIFFDGVVNAKGVGIGAILISPTGQHYPAIARLWLFCTNTEYEACIMVMNMVVDMDVEDLLIMGDSDLIIRQAQADGLAALAAMLPYPSNVHIDPLEIQIRERHGYCNTVEIKLDIQSWYHDIKRFLKTKEYPSKLVETKREPLEG
ncbi:uncharacterized protein [Nicotiana sylvestris]|uniref:uncharacterized protein n=1 Tax=Nicotiana sylvestris TaxID=4096 RepID=UPI00388C6116